MKATLNSHVIAASDDALEYDNYRYFRRAGVRDYSSARPSPASSTVRPSRIW